MIYSDHNCVEVEQSYDSSDILYSKLYDNSVTSRLLYYLKKIKEYLKTPMY